jgi:hypothetical protein
VSPAFGCLVKVHLKVCVQSLPFAFYPSMHPTNTHHSYAISVLHTNYIQMLSAVVTEAEGVVIGAIGALISVYSNRWCIWMQIDDPCSAFAIHGASGMWGVISGIVWLHFVFSKD